MRRVTMVGLRAFILPTARLLQFVGAVGFGFGVFGREIHIPNGSFESPPSPFVSLNIDNWQKAPKPVDYIEEGGFLWSQLVGIFKNTAPDQPDHIINCDGNQALWMFAVPGVMAFQDYDSMDWNDPIPSRAFDARFESGKSYILTTGIIGGGGGMLPGATLDISLYFRDASGNRRPVATTTAIHSTASFPSVNRFEEVVVRVPMVRPDDEWAGRNIGIQFHSTVSTSLQGGYWDVDHIRLVSSERLVVSNPSFDNGAMRFTVSGDPAQRVQVVSSASAESPITDWGPLVTWTNFPGSMVYTAAVGSEQRRFYAARLLP
jgi:hypothetical protein